MKPTRTSTTLATGSTAHVQQIAMQDDHDRMVMDAASPTAKVEHHYRLESRLSHPLLLAIAAALGLACLVIAASPDLLP